MLARPGNPMRWRRQIFTQSDLSTLSREAFFGEAEPTPDPPTNFNLYWKFDEASGTNVIDEAGAHNGTLVGTPTRVPGKIGDGAIRLNGGGQYISFTPWNVGTAHTVASWINFLDNTDGALFANAPGDYALYYDTANFYYSASSGIFVSQPHGLKLPVGRFVHFAVRRNGTQIQFFLDGKPLGTPKTLSGNDTLDLGRIGQYTNASFAAAAELDEFRVYLRALGNEEIFSLAAWDGVESGEDIEAPVVNLTSSLTHKMSDETGNDAYAYSFVVSEAAQAWKIKLVSNASDLHSSGTLVESGGAIAAGATVTGSITYAELVSAGVGGEGDKLLKVFAQDIAGNWST